MDEKLYKCIKDEFDYKLGVLEKNMIMIFKEQADSIRELKDELQSKD